MAKKLSAKARQQKSLKRAERKRNQARQKEMDEATTRLCAFARGELDPRELEQ